MIMLNQIKNDITCRKTFAGASLAILAALSTAPTMAQSPEDKTTSSIKPQAPEEILVTARKREERLQDVPVAITAFTSQTLKDRGIRDITEIALQTAGFAMQNFQRTTEQPFIRGQSVNSSLYPRATASSFVDGIWVQGVGRAISMDDLARVEVLKGPQATEFGRASFAGAVNYVAKRPTFEPSGELNLTGGEVNDVGGSIAVSGPIIKDTLAARVFVGGSGRGSEWRNLTDGRGIGGQQAESGSFSLLATPTQSFDAYFRLQFARIADSNQAQSVSRYSLNNCRPSAAGAFQAYCGELPIFTNITQYTAGAYKGGFKSYNEYRGEFVMNYTTENFRITSQSGYNDGRGPSGASDGSDLGAPVLAGALLTYFETFFHDFSQDVRISSVGDGRWRWLAGVSYLDAYRNDNEQRFPATTALPNPFLTKNYSGYGQLSFDFLPQLTGNFEGRYQSETVERQLLVNGIKYKTTFDNFLPRLSLDYKVTGDAMVYGSVAQGNKPGFFNTSAGVPVQYIPVKEESTWVYEVGTKIQWLNRRLTTNLAAYYINWSDLAASLNVGQVDANGNPILAGGIQRTVQVTANAAKATVKGLELETFAKITPEWTAAFVYSYNEAKFDNYVSLIVGALGGAQQVGGNYLWNTPKNKWTLSSTYRAPVPGHESFEWFTSADLTWKDIQFVDELNTAWLPSLYLLNARVGVEAKNWTFTVYGRNLNNTKVPEYATKYLSDYTHTPTVPNYIETLRPGRNFGASLNYRF